MLENAEINMLGLFDADATNKQRTSGIMENANLIGKI